MFLKWVPRLLLAVLRGRSAVCAWLRAAVERVRWSWRWRDPWVGCSTTATAPPLRGLRALVASLAQRPSHLLVVDSEPYRWADVAARLAAARPPRAVTGVLRRKPRS